MLPFNLISFCSLSVANNGEIRAFDDLRLGNSASAGMFQVLPVRNAPSIFPLRSEMPYFWANAITDIYSIFHTIGKFCNRFQLQIYNFLPISARKSIKEMLLLVFLCNMRSKPKWSLEEKIMGISGMIDSFFCIMQFT